MLRICSRTARAAPCRDFQHVLRIVGHSGMAAPPARGRMFQWPFICCCVHACALHSDSFVCTGCALYRCSCIYRPARLQDSRFAESQLYAVVSQQCGSSMRQVYRVHDGRFRFRDGNQTTHELKSSYSFWHGSMKPRGTEYAQAFLSTVQCSLFSAAACFLNHQFFSV